MPHVDNPASDASAHIADASDAHDASAISVNSATLVGVGTDVQAVLEELDDAVAAAGSPTGDFAGLIAFSGSIEPPQITADVNNYNPTSVATASVIRVSSDATRFMSGLAATATNGRIVTLQNTGSFDIILRQDSGSSAAGNRFKIPAPMNIKPNEGVVLQYDTTASRWRVVGGVPDSPPSTILDNFYVSTNGSDQNDGRSWKSSMLTPAAAIAAAAGTGDIWFGPGLFTWADTLTIAQGVRLHGKSPHAAASGGTEFKWSGPDDGRPGLITAASAATDWSQGIIENIRFNGLTAAMTGGGNCLNIRNAQNGAKLFNVHVVGWSTGIGINVYTVLNTGYPGYASFENVWVTGGKVAGWNIECPMTDLLFLHCGSDPVGAQATAHAWILSSPGYPTGAAVNKTITSSSQSGAVATHIITGHGASVGWQVDISGSNVDGYNGVHYVSSVVDANTITVNMGALTGLGAGTGGTMYRVAGGDYGTATFIACKSESGVADAGWLFRSATGIAMIGCSYLEQTDNAGGIAFEYRGPLRNIEGDVLVAPRLSMTECISQNMEYQFVASKFGISIKPNNGYGGGRRQHITYTGHMNTPVTDLVAMPVPANPLSGTRRMFTDSATGEVSVRTSAGATVSLEGSAGSPAASAVTVDSTTLVGTGANQQAVDEEFDNAIVAAQATADNHIGDTTAAHAATAIAFTPDGSIAATTVQAAIVEVRDEAWIPVTFNMDGTLATGVGVSRWYNDSGRTLTIAKVRGAVGTAPSGASILADVNIGGTTIWSTQGNRVAIAAASNTGTQTSFNTTTIADGSYFTMDIDQVGSGTVGADLVVTIWLKG